MKKYLKFMFVAILSVAFTFCESNEPGEETKAPSEQKGFVVGKIVDSQGKPISGAKIYLDNTVFYDSSINGSTGDDGTYKIKLYQGVWKAYASFKKEYNGKTYSIQLCPDNADSFTEEGTVRNFTWKLEGTDPGDDYYYGGLITVYTEYGFNEDFDDIQLTFTPKGPMIDGSAGKTLTIKYGGHYWNDWAYIKDVPIGRYLVTAKLKNNSLLRIKNLDSDDDAFVSELQLDFMPDLLDFRPTNYANIVIGY